MSTDKPVAPEAAPSEPPTAATAATAVAATDNKPRFPIVGIGASAGGLEAFEQFFRNLPPTTGMAFVLMPHLDPGHDSVLAEILQRSTTLPVIEAHDQVRVAPNSVYVVPPNREMSIFHGILQLALPETPRAQRMPIDAFLRSLAEDQGEHAIGILLSGTGTDGTLGLRAILGAGGISLVQEPATAKFDGMPSSAIHAGYATHVLPPDRMPQALQANHLALITAHPVMPLSAAAQSGLTRILMALRSATGHDFSLYKKSTVGRRIERRMAQHDIGDMEVYARYLKENPAELQTLFRELLINVTSFFRDPDAFAALKNDILPGLCADCRDSFVFRAWVAGCASGEEAYSIAILLREYMDEIHRDFKVQIYATDLDDEAIATARAGVYPPNIAQDVSPERLRRFFTKEEGGYRVKKDIREMVVFAIQSVIKDPPFTKLDLLSCRNLMIYLEPDMQKRVIAALHYALKPGGVLFLSPSESIGNHPELFAAQNRKWKLYRAIHSLASTRTVMTSGLSWAADSPNRSPDDVMKKASEPNFAELARRLLLQSYAPASVVTDTKGNLLYVHGDTGPYLRPAPGQATLNIVDMARDGLQLELRSAMQAAAQGTLILNREVALKGTDDYLPVAFSVRPLPNTDAPEGLVLVSFQELARSATTKPGRRKRKSAPNENARADEIQRELAYTRENLQATIEEQQASNEELKSTNEEMQSTNEELQSTNEELETSKEELQSVNEELITVNAELQAKIEQLAGMQNDMKNLLDNISVGTIFLDEHLCIRRFTREAARVYRLVASDVGRPLADIKTDIVGDDLLLDARAVLDTLASREREVATTGGAWYLARIQPYRTLDNVIEGVVLTFADISDHVAAEATAHAAQALAEGIVDTVREPLLVLDEHLHVVTASRAYLRYFRTTPEQTVGQSLYAIGQGQWNIPALRDLVDTVLPQDLHFDDLTLEQDFPLIGRRRIVLNARRLVGHADAAPRILLAMDPIPDASTQV